MMKIACLVSFSLVLALSNAAPLEGVCTDGSPNGAQIDRGRFIFQCQNGQIVPKGCYTDDLKQIDIGSTFDRKFYRLQCKQQGQELTLELAGCLLDGQQHSEGENFEQGNNFYACQRKGDELQLINLGCVDNGKRINLNDQVVKGDYVLLCNSTVNNKAKLVPNGCVKDGKQYLVGDSFEIGRIWYKCERFGRETVELHAAGCVSNGRRLNDGDRFVENDVAYECMIDSTTRDIRVTACMQNDNGQQIERKLGCYFNDGQAPFQYEMRCVEDEKNKSAKKVFIRCKYDTGKGVLSIEPGCYRLVDNAAFGCQKDSDKLTLQSFQGPKAETSAQAAGLNAC